MKRKMSPIKLNPISKFLKVASPNPTKPMKTLTSQL